MKKYKKALIISISYLLFGVMMNQCFGISEKFQFVIDTIGVPRYNVYGEEINEQVYYIYNVFSYSSPEAMYGIVKNQRFKEVPTQGKWLSGGKRGEYYLLGRGYSGQTVANVYFPVDGTPEITPDKWNYIYTAGAYNSWMDKSKYKYEEQLSYMKNSKLLFDTIDYSTNTCNSYNLVKYNITPNTIGLDKVLLNTCATWKTYGIVTVNRIDRWGRRKYATMAVEPMAASASVKSKFSSSGSNTIKSIEDKITLNLNFGAQAINLSSYAKENQIKEISSTIFINGKEIAKISGSKRVNLDKNIQFTVSRGDFSSPGKNKIHIKVVSYLYTEFYVDGLMQDTLETDLQINVDEKLIVPAALENGYIQKKRNDVLVVSPLVQTNETKTKNSIGVIEKERMMALKLNLHKDVEKIEEVEVYLENNKIDSKILYSNNNKYVIGFEVPKGTENTVNSWKYLREHTGNYLDVNFDDIGKRIKDPIEGKVKYKFNNKDYEVIFKFDTIDSYKDNINFIFDKNVINKDIVNKEFKISEV